MTLSSSKLIVIWLTSGKLKLTLLFHVYWLWVGQLFTTLGKTLGREKPSVWQIIQEPHIASGTSHFQYVHDKNKDKKFYITGEMSFKCYFIDSIAKSHIFNPTKSLWWSFFVTIINDFYLLTFFAKMSHHKSLTLFQKHLCRL